MRIGIILTGDYGWAGGVYYSLTIIKLLHAISFQKKLTTVVIVNASTPAELIHELPKDNVELAYLDKKPFLYRLYHRLANNRFVADVNQLHLDVLYPLIDYHPTHAKLNCKVLYWLYDFQHKFLPQLFSPEEIKNRDDTFGEIAAHARDIVFSSNDSKQHFEKFYPASKATKQVFSFVSLLKVSDAKINNQDHSENYFIVCNQFWPHKNHLVVLKALSYLLKEGKNTQIVFTGKYSDGRNKSYVDSLKEFIREQQLETHITLTGFISRDEQVKLIINAMAVVQPSFFEGWSTVVEDAKALNKFMITSDIAVNKEQLRENVLFFDPKNEVELADCMQQVMEKKIKHVPLDYNRNIEAAKKELIKLFKI